jgi:hypothetical protein
LGRVRLELGHVSHFAWAVPGSTVLAGGFPRPHASEEARSIAENGMILRVQMGSGVHGTSISGQDDRDEMGLCLEPPEFVIGLARVPDGAGGQAPRVGFGQYERHTPWDRPGGMANRSGAGDLDVIIYSATPRASGRGWRWPGTRQCCWCCSFPAMRSSSVIRLARS